MLRKHFGRRFVSSSSVAARRRHRREVEFPCAVWRSTSACARGMTPDEARRTTLRDFGGVDPVDGGDPGRREALPSGISCRRICATACARCADRPATHSPRCSCWRSASAPTPRSSRVIDGVLLKPLPFRDSRKLVLIQESAPASNLAHDRRGDSGVLRLPRPSPVGEGSRRVPPDDFTCSSRAIRTRVDTGVVSANFFHMLGVKDRSGATFVAARDDAARRRRRAHAERRVLAHEVRRRSVRSSGASSQMNDRPHTVIGVLPAVPAVPADERRLHVDVGVSVPLRGGEDAAGAVTGRSRA